MFHLQLPNTSFSQSTIIPIKGSHILYIPTKRSCDITSCEKQTYFHTQRHFWQTKLCFSMPVMTQLWKHKISFWYCFDIMCSMLFLWPFNIKIYLSIHIYILYYMLWIYMQTFLSSIASKIIPPSLNGPASSDILSHFSWREKHEELHHSHPETPNNFSADLFFFFFYYISLI